MGSTKIIFPPPNILVHININAFIDHFRIPLSVDKLGALDINNKGHLTTKIPF
jgi:hypothetical protein